ncbi:MAG: hypothetical protein JNK82_17455, partial [Myxococcaceae bacterium]|nr:hypothetical protein [Myxococcaceae bacterium]
MHTSALILLTLTVDPNQSGPLRDLGAFEEAYQFECNAPWAVIEQPTAVKYGGFIYDYSGSWVKVRREANAKGTTKLGLLAGIKDLEPETQETLKRFFAEFEKQ